jgi:hypothetical protein
VSVHDVAAETTVITWLHAPPESFEYGPPDDVLRKTRYPPPGGNVDNASQDSDRLVVVAFEAPPAPGVFSATACACPVPFPEAVV